MTTFGGLVSSADDGELAATTVLDFPADLLGEGRDDSASGTHLMAIPVWLWSKGTARHISF